METVTDEDFVTASEAARLLGVTRQRVANMIRDNELDAVRPWPRTVLIRKADIDAYMQGVRPTPIHKTAVRRWLFMQEGARHGIPLETLTPLVRRFIAEHRPQWDERSRDNWTIGMLGLLDDGGDE